MMKTLPSTLTKNNLFFLFLAITLIFVSCSKGGDSTPPATQPATITSVTSSTGTTSGPKNTIITIAGTNFITDITKIEVKVNGKSCTVLTATSTAITAKIPPACGTGTVELFLDGVRYAGPVFNFIYTLTVSSVTNGIVGYADGPVASAQFDQIMSVSIDGNNNIYTAQYDKPRIRKISAAGIASNLAGNGTGGYTDAQGINARFGAMDFCSADAMGNVYVADQVSASAPPTTNTNKIRKIDVNGNVTTVAIIPFSLEGIKVAKSGNIYVCGYSDIAKYTASGTLVWRLTSHGTGNVDGDTSIVQFTLPGGIEVDDSENNIYVSNILYPGSQLKKLNLTTKTITTIAGDGTSGDISTGPALSCKFRFITCSVLDSIGGLYFAEGYNNKICYLKDGVVTTIINGTYNTTLDVDGDVSVARIAYPFGLALDSQGQVFLGCFKNNKVKKIVRD